MTENIGVNVVASSEANAQLSFPLQLSELVYTSCYCEENVFMLCKQLQSVGLSCGSVADLVVVFISNASRSILLWGQRSGGDRNGLVCWDYHVLCIKVNNENICDSEVLDQDSTLPFPCPLKLYISKAFWGGSDEPVKLLPTYKRLFRLVQGSEFVKHFASDRSHMVNQVGDWLKPPPTYPCIVAEDGMRNNLQEYVSMLEEDQTEPTNLSSLLAGRKRGIVVNEEKFIELFQLQKMAH